MLVYAGRKAVDNFAYAFMNKAFLSVLEVLQASISGDKVSVKELH